VIADIDTPEDYANLGAAKKDASEHSGGEATSAKPPAGTHAGE
jgi:hypothetical protein